MSRRKSETGARFARLFQPVIDAITQLGGSARPSEVKEWILGNLQLPDKYVSDVHQGGESKFGNDVDWARFYLVRSGYLDASKRGVWTITDKGRKTRIDAALTASIIREVDNSSRISDAQPIHRSDESSTATYIDEALTLMKKLPPKGFENLCQRLLRESGFEEVTVTGRSGDGGIDGQGILKVNAFVSFRVLFQCKRYNDSVGPSVIRDFRGAMAGRAEKGIILTTGYFTPQAEAEASRDGAQPIEIVDGENFVQLLANLELGFRPVTTYEVDETFFNQFN